MAGRSTRVSRRKRWQQGLAASYLELMPPIYGEHLANVSTEHMIEMTEADRRRVFNLGYYTWVEQQGTPFELFEERRHQSFWRNLRRYVGGGTR